MRTARGQHSKWKWAEDQRRLFKDMSGLQSELDPGLHLTSFLTTGPIIPSALSLAHKPMPNHTMSPWGSGPWVIHSHTSGRVLTFNVKQRNKWGMNKQVTVPEKPAILGTSLEKKNCLPQQCHFRNKHCFPSHLSYFQGIYHLQTFRKCLVLRTIADAVSRSLSHKLRAFILGLKFIQMLTWLNWTQYKYNCLYPNKSVH